MDTGGNSGRGGSTASFNVGQNGFAPALAQQGNIDVVAPLNVNAAPSGAMRLANALGQFQQQTAPALQRMAWEQSQADFKAGQVHGEEALNPDGTYNMKTFAGKSAAFQEGALRGAAGKLAENAKQEWDQEFANSTELQNMHTPDLMKRYNDFMQERLGGMQHNDIAKEEIGPRITQWADQIAGQQTHKELIEHQQDMLDNAYSKGKAAWESGTIDTEDILKNNVLPAVGNMRQAQTVMMDLMTRLAQEKGDTSILDQYKQQSIAAGHPFGLQADEQFQAAYKNVQAVQTAKEKLETTEAFKPTMMMWQHNWDANRAIPQSWIDQAYAGGKGPLTFEQYHSLSDYNKGISDKQTSWQLGENTLKRYNGNYAAAMGQSLRDPKNPGASFDMSAAKEHYQAEMDNKFGSGNDNKSMLNRATAPGGTLENLMDNKKVGFLDDRTKDWLNGLDMTNPQDVVAAHQVIQWIDNGHKSVTAKLGLSDNQMFQMRAASMDMDRRTSPADIAEGNKQVDSQVAAQRLKTGSREIDNARAANPNPIISDQSHWYSALPFQNIRQDQLSPSSRVERDQYSRALAMQIYQSGKATAEQSAAIAEQVTVGRSTFTLDQNGKYNWQLTSTATKDEHGRNYDSKDIGAALTDMSNNIGDLIPKGQNPKDYSITKMPGLGDMYALTDQFGHPVQRPDKSWSYWSLRDIMDFHGKLVDARNDERSRAANDYNKRLEEARAEDYLDQP